MADTQPRVNSALLPKFEGRTVRLPCKILGTRGDSAMSVQASDGGEIIVNASGSSTALAGSTYAEIIGTVADSATIRMLSFVDMGSNLDMTVVDKTIQVMHDPKFAHIFSE